MASLFTGVDLFENALTMNAIREVGPGSHFLGAAHTQANLLTAFHRAGMSDGSSYEQWLAEGGLDPGRRAKAEWKRLLSRYEDPGLDPSTDEALEAYVAKRKEGTPDVDYF